MKSPTEANSELTRVGERRVAEWERELRQPARQGFENAPAAPTSPSPRSSDARRRELGLRQHEQVAKQATEIAEANVAAATETGEGPGESKKGRLKRQNGR